MVVQFHLYMKRSQVADQLITQVAVWLPILLLTATNGNPVLHSDFPLMLEILVISTFIFAVLFTVYLIIEDSCIGMTNDQLTVPQRIGSLVGAIVVAMTNYWLAILAVSAATSAIF